MGRKTKEPLIISAEFNWLLDLIKKFETDKVRLQKVVCFMLYYARSKPTRAGVKRTILELFNADAYSQRRWIQYPTDEKAKTVEEVEALLNEDRFREYDNKALEIVNKKYKSKNTLPVYDWAQSTFVPNCPIYYVEKGPSMLMRIEYDVLGKTGTWSIEILNGFAKSKIHAEMNEVEKTKRIAEQELQKTLRSLK